MLNFNLLKLSFAWNLDKNVVCRVWSNSFWHYKIILRDENERNVYSLIKALGLSHIFNFAN